MKEIKDFKDIDIPNLIIKSKEENKKFNFFVTILDNPKTENEDGPLANIPCVVKDNFSTKGILTTASSNTLNNYIPIFDATVIEKLKSSGAVIIGKTVLDELGMGGTGLTGHTGIVKNPLDSERICGGSSAGSVGAVAAGLVPFSLGSDTGDSIRKPASFCGVVGYKPTYGLISRYGLIPFASSLDHVGVMTTNVKDAAVVTNILKGQDENDMTSLDSSNINLVSDLENNITNEKFFYIKDVCDINYYSNPSEELKLILENFKKLIDKLTFLGHTVVGVDFDSNLMNALKPSYDSISSAEATSNNSNLTGIIFGPRAQGSTSEEIIVNYRTSGFSPLIKRRFVIGSYVLLKENQEKYYLNACRVRRLIVDKINELYKNYGNFIMPASGSTAPKIENATDVISKESVFLENHLIIGNFGGYPSITIPAFTINNLPVGINLTGKVLDDKNLLNVAYNLEKIIKEGI